MGSSKRNVGREITLSLVAALVFGIGMYVYLKSTMPSAEELKAEMKMTAPSARGLTMDLVDSVSAVGTQFIAHLQHGQYEAAFALTAKGYRESASLAQFTATCRGTPYLASAKEVSFIRVSQQSIKLESGEIAKGSALARGMLISEAGNVDVSFAFAPEGDDFRVLTILAAGVPIFQALTPGTSAFPTVPPGSTVSSGTAAPGAAPSGSAVAPAGSAKAAQKK